MFPFFTPHSFTQSPPSDSDLSNPKPSFPFCMDIDPPYSPHNSHNPTTTTFTPASPNFVSLALAHIPIPTFCAHGSTDVPQSASLHDSADIPHLDISPPPLQPTRKSTRSTTIPSYL